MKAMNILELIDSLIDEGRTEVEAELIASEYFGIYEPEDDD